MNKRVWIIVLSVFIVLAAVMGGSYYIYRNYIDTDKIYTGIFIDVYDVGNMDKDEALEFLKENKNIDDKEKIMNLQYLDKNYNVSSIALGMTYNFQDAITQAYDYAREGTFFSRYEKIRNLEKDNLSIELQGIINEGLLNSLIDSIAEEIDEQSLNAAILIDSNGDITIKDGTTGKLVQKDDLKKIITDNINSGTEIMIPVDETVPAITKEKLERINGKLGEFSTSFKNSSAGRAHNIKLSAESLNDIVLLPGQDISYNNTTGPRQAKFGYKEAPVIVNGELTPGTGGGVCQTSTTLYNALLLSNVTILERHPHSIAPVYVPKGQDGAVATGYLDLRFRNDFDYPIYIKSKVEGTRVSFTIYGDEKGKDYTVKIEPVIYQTIPYKVREVLDNNVAAGSRQLIQEGRNGYKVRTYKSIIKDDKVVEKVQITSDYYREKDYIYKVGLAVVAPTPTTPPVTDPPLKDTSIEEPSAPVINPEPEPSTIEGETGIPIDELEDIVIEESI